MQCLLASLTARDRALLRDVWLYRYVTTAQLARLHFGGHRKLAQRRLRILTERGVVDRFHPARAPQIGFGMWWYRLARAGARIVAEEQAQPLVAILPPSRQPRSMGALEHHALTTDMRIWLREGCATSGFRYAFIPGYDEMRHKGRRRRRIALVLQGHDRLLIPDGACMLTHDGTSALFVLEIDRGTEPLTGRHPSAITRKLHMYRDAFDAHAEAQYAPLFQTAVTGFRILCLVPTEQRQHGFLRLAEQHDLAPLVWTTTTATLRARGDLTTRCWAVTRTGPLHRLTE